jgi:diaminopimelate decarboxylase
MVLRPEDWGFAVDADGMLLVGGASTHDLARVHGTPLHVIDEAGLRSRARRFRMAFDAAYPGSVTAHYALKCNNTPGVVKMILEEGLRPEVGTLYEWDLARELDVPPRDVVVNGPCKGSLLERAITAGAGLLVVDSFEELGVVATLAERAHRRPRVLLRVNPNCVPKGMNRASATGSRKQSVFGFDLESGEVHRALRWLRKSRSLHFAGLHAHVGTGIRSPEDYRRPLRRLVACAAEANRLGLQVEVLDTGGGFGVATSREFNTREFLIYQAIGRLPQAPRADRFPAPEAFAHAVAGTVADACAQHGVPLPRLVIEPGRAITSSAGVLLVTVGAIKQREGVGTWAITDGGAGTVAFPLFYEYHEVLLCRAPSASRSRTYSMVGAACHSADWIYRNKKMPPLRPGDVLAICDAGAYFTVQECNFGFPRPAIVAVRDGSARLLRSRETFDEMVQRDAAWRTRHVA